MLNDILKVVYIQRHSPMIRFYTTLWHKKWTNLTFCRITRGFICDGCFMSTGAVYLSSTLPPPHKGLVCTLPIATYRYSRVCRDFPDFTIGNSIAFSPFNLTFSIVILHCFLPSRAHCISVVSPATHDTAYPPPDETYFSMETLMVNEWR